MRLYIIRHGETEWNASGYLQGQSDIALNTNGIRLAAVTAKGMAEIQFDLAISSPLKRAVDTARLVLGDRNVPILTDERLMEISFGSLEGKTYRGANAQIPQERFRLFYEDPFHFEYAEDGESIPQLIQRLNSFFRDLRSREDLQDKTILIATHGCALRAFLQSFDGADYDYWMGGVPLNCAVTIAELDKEHAEILELDHIYYDLSEVVNYFSHNS